MGPDITSSNMIAELVRRPRLGSAPSDRGWNSPAVVAVHAEGLPGIADVLLQSQRASACSCSTLRTPGPILVLGSIRRSLSQIHLVEFNNTCWWWSLTGTDFGEILSSQAGENIAPPRVKESFLTAKSKTIYSQCFIPLCL